MAIKYVSNEGWRRGYRWAIIDIKTGKAISIARTEEEAELRNRNFSLFRKTTRRIVPITLENVEA